MTLRDFDGGDDMWKRVEQIPITLTPRINYCRVSLIVIFYTLTVFIATTCMCAPLKVRNGRLFSNTNMNLLIFNTHTLACVVPGRLCRVEGQSGG